MRLDKLDIYNFKCYEHLQLELSSGINVFVGINGSGKTAVLEAAAVALGGFLRSIISRPISLSQIRKASGITQEFCRIAVEGHSNNGESLIWEQTMKNIARSNDITGTRAATEYGNTILKEFNNPLSKMIAPIIAYYSTQRLFKSGPQKYNESSGRRNGYLQCLDEKTIIGTLEDWLGKAVTNRATNQIKGFEKQNNTLDAVEQAIRQTLELMDEHGPDLDLVEYQDAYNDFELCFRIKKADGSITDLPLSNFSDGFRNLIFLVLDLMWRASMLNPWLTYEEIREQSYGVVLIDELDLHLHPKWQSRAIALLQRLLPKVQFLITTHSPTLIANYKLREGDSLFTLENNEVKIAPSYFGRDLDSVIEGLFDEPSRNLEIKEKIGQLYRLLEQGPRSNRLPALERIRKNMLEYMDSTDPDMIRLTGMFDLLESEGYEHTSTGQ